jgi:hypothetical protein
MQAIAEVPCRLRVIRAIRREDDLLFDGDGRA